MSRKALKAVARTGLAAFGMKLARLSRFHAIIKEIETARRDLETARMIAEINLTPTLLAGSPEKGVQLFGVNSRRCFNPSIAQYGGQLIATSRSSNCFPILERPNTIFGGEILGSVVNLHFLNGNYLPASVWSISDRRVREFLGDSFLAIEDARLFEWRHSLWFIGAAVFGSCDSGYVIKQILCKISIEDCEICDFTVFDSPYGRLVEKNWTPVVVSETLYFVYSIDPYILYKFCDKDGLILVAGSEPESAHENIRLRGGTPLVRCGSVGGGEGYISIAHFPPIVTDRLYYRHAFVYYDSSLMPIDISVPFFLLRKGIEFAAGIAVENDHIVISFGVGDQASYISRFPKEELKHYLLHASN